MKILAKIMSEYQITKMSMDYSIQKLAKLGFFFLWGTFDVYNRKFWPLELTGSISRVLTDVHKIFWHKLCRNPDHQKVHRLKQTKIGKIRGVPGLGHI